MARIKTLERTITGLLTNHPHLRDNDRKLVATVWWQKVGEPLEYLVGKDILKMYADGDLPDVDSITRCRRRLQEVREDLRGIKWESRHKSENEIIKEVRGIGV